MVAMYIKVMKQLGVTTIPISSKDTYFYFNETSIFHVESTNYIQSQFHFITDVYF